MRRAEEGIERSMTRLALAVILTAAAFVAAFAGALR